MTKQDLVEKLVVSCKRRNLSKAAASDLVESMFDNLALAIRRGRRFSYPGFGTFLVRKRKERKGRNPQTGQETVFAASKSVLFRPSAALKQSLNK
ncbi:MAG: HU family DNA-binding protein [Pseudomonadota bacterium]